MPGRSHLMLTGVIVLFAGCYQRLMKDALQTMCLSRDNDVGSGRANDAPALVGGPTNISQRDDAASSRRASVLAGATLGHSAAGSLMHNDSNACLGVEQFPTRSPFSPSRTGCGLTSPRARPPAAPSWNARS